MTRALWTVFGLFFIFFMTSVGAACVFFANGNGKHKESLIGFSAGIMISAAFWSLLLPAVSISSDYGSFAFMPIVIGLLLGGVFVTAIDLLSSRKQCSADKKSVNFFWAVTVHNIPEGASVGFAFGALSNPLAAFSVALGIGIQNFPEGLAVALPFRLAGKSKKKSFVLGVISGAVEPVFGAIGYFLANYLMTLQPWILSFAAGAMLFVSAGELLPECAKNKSGVWGFLLGFVFMTALDVAFG